MQYNRKKNLREENYHGDRSYLRRFDPELENQVFADTSEALPTANFVITMSAYRKIMVERDVSLIGPGRMIILKWRSVRPLDTPPVCPAPPLLRIRPTLLAFMPAGKAPIRATTDLERNSG